jgi:hypothetical protein
MPLQRHCRLVPALYHMNCNLTLRQVHLPPLLVANSSLSVQCAPALPFTGSSAM